MTLGPSPARLRPPAAAAHLGRARPRSAPAWEKTKSRPVAISVVPFAVVPFSLRCSLRSRPDRRPGHHRHLRSRPGPSGRPRSGQCCPLRRHLGANGRSRSDRCCNLRCPPRSLGSSPSGLVPQVKSSS